MGEMARQSQTKESTPIRSRSGFSHVPRSYSPRHLLFPFHGLQSAFGNQATRNFLQPGPVQAKGAAGVPSEPAPSLAGRIHSLQGSGNPLRGSTRSYFEDRFGSDFSNVRVHTDTRATETARELKARAYTLGRDIVFAAGQYAPETSSGKQLLAHELTHVLQQKAEHLPRVIAGKHVSDDTDQSVIRRQTISDCIGGERQAVEAATTLAAIDLNASIMLLSVRPLSPTVRAALFLAFRSESDDTADTVKSNLEEVRDELPTDGFVCRRQGDWLYGAHCAGNTAAFTPHASAYLGLMGVTICIPRYLGMTPANQAAAIIHEGTHRHQQTDDNGYFAGTEHLESQATAGTSPSTRLDNADSFSSFVYYLIHSNAGAIDARARTYRGENLGIQQIPGGPIDLSGNDPRVPLFEVTGIPANSGYRYRWVIDVTGNRWRMWSDQGSVFAWCRATQAYINTPTRTSLKDGGYNAARILCRVQLWRGAESNDPAGTILLELPVTFV